MKRILLFSTLTADNRTAVLDQLFPASMPTKVFSYIPSSGVEDSGPYIEQWRSIAQQYDAQFHVIDITANDPREQKKLLDSNIVLISGGNTFNLLQNLRNSGLASAIAKFTDKPAFVLAGFSAGAVVLTPTIQVCNLPAFDENLVGLTNLAGLNIVDFEIFPHYDEQLQKIAFEQYRKTTTNNVQAITDNDFISINR